MQMQPITFYQNLAQRVAVIPLSGTGAANAVSTAKPTAHNTPTKPSSPVFAPQSPCLQIRPTDCAPEGALTNITRNPIGPHPASAPLFASVSPATFEAWKPLPQKNLTPSILSLCEWHFATILQRWDSEAAPSSEMFPCAL